MANDSTGFYTSLLLFGYEMRTPSLWSSPFEFQVNTQSVGLIKQRILYIDDVLKRLQKEATINSTNKKKMKERYDKDAIETPRF